MTSKFRGLSFGKILDLNRGVGLGFDLLRLGLAVSILMAHASGIGGHRGFLSGILADFFHLAPNTLDALGSGVENINVTEQNQPVRGIARPLTLARVPMFFALSGFLVAGSAFRTKNVVPFLGLRALRIVPALFVEVVLSAVFLGAIFTTLPLETYFTHPEFFAYFGNIIGDVHFRLPGVFVGTSGSSNVNSNLWTLPAEFQCYLIVSALMITTIVYSRILFTILFVGSTISLLIASLAFDYQITGGTVYGPVNTYYFFCGVFIYLWRDKFIYHELIVLPIILITYALMMFSRTVFIYPLLLTYITIFIGLTAFPRIAFLSKGDYSYGIYLYGYPVTQAIIATFPAYSKNLLFIEVSALVMTALFAFGSWHAIEKHALKLKRFIFPPSAKVSEALHPDTFDESRVVDGTKRSTLSLGTSGSGG